MYLLAINTLFNRKPETLDVNTHSVIMKTPDDTPEVFICGWTLGDIFFFYKRIFFSALEETDQ